MRFFRLMSRVAAELRNASGKSRHGAVISMITEEVLAGTGRRIRPVFFASRPFVTLFLTPPHFLFCPLTGLRSLVRFLGSAAPPPRR